MDYSIGSFTILGRQVEGNTKKTRVVGNQRVDIYSTSDITLSYGKVTTVCDFNLQFLDNSYYTSDTKANYYELPVYVFSSGASDPTDIISGVVRCTASKAGEKSVVQLGICAQQKGYTLGNGDMIAVELSQIVVD